MPFQTGGKQECTECGKNGPDRKGMEFVGNENAYKDAADGSNDKESIEHRITMRILPVIVRIYRWIGFGVVIFFYDLFPPV